MWGGTGRTDNGVPEASALQNYKSFRKNSSLVVIVENIFPSTIFRKKLLLLQRYFFIQIEYDPTGNQKET